MKPTVSRVAFALLALSSSVFAQQTPAAAEPVVELPKFVVTDNRELPQPESWRYATIEGFEILTNASDRATQRMVRDFEVFRQALGYIWPVPQRISQTTSLIIAGRGNKFDAFVPRKAGGGVDVATASLFLKQGNQTAIVIDLQSTTLNILNVDGADDPATGTDSGLISVEHDKQLYREYVRYLLSRNEPRLPAWFEEGLSQIIMRMQIHDRRTIEFARLEDPNTVSVQAATTAELNALATADDPDTPTLPGAPAEDRDFNVALRRRALVPLERLFAVAHDSPEATNVLGNNIWAKQSYAFVHMCLYGERGKFQKPFLTFLQRVQREPVTEAMFKECFNMTYKQMLMQIRSYSETTVYESKGVQAKKGGPDLIIPPPPLALREATQSEIGRIKGEALVLAGKPTQARAELIAPYTRGERDPELLAALGLFEKKNGENDRARKFLEAAHAGKTKRPDALLELARFRYADAIAKPAAANNEFSAEQVKAITEPLLVARRQPPHNYAVYDLLADTWARSAAKPKRDDAVPIIEGALLFPTRLKLVYQCVFFASDIGDLKSAHALADHGLKYAPDANVKNRFAQVKAQLAPAPVEASTAPAATNDAAAKTGGK
jgi:hypothetical protein